MASDYKPITGPLLGLFDTCAEVPKGNDGDYFILLKDDGNHPAGVHRVNADGTFTQYGGIGGELRASISMISTQITAVKTLISTSSVSPEAMADAVKVLQDSIATAIAQWDSKRQYKKGQVAMANKAWFLCLADNVGKDPLTDNSGAWGIFNPGSANDVFSNRSPVNTDVYPAGVKWWDTSFGADTPLGFISLGSGAWQYLNQISLSRIRINVVGMYSTYRSGVESIKFYKADGTAMPFGWFVWGKGTVMPVSAGVSYTGQKAGVSYNASGYFELEPSSSFDASVSISKVMGAAQFISIGSIEFYYSNGSRKLYSGCGNVGTGGIVDATLCVCDPNLPCRYGDSIAAVQGPNLVAAELANKDHLTYGRVNGREFASAVMQLLAPLEARVKALEPTTPPVNPNAVNVAFTKEGAEFVANVESLTGKQIQFGSVDWLLNQSAPTLRQVSQGGGQSGMFRHLYPTDPGSYNLQGTGRFTDGESFQFRFDFTVA